MAIPLLAALLLLVAGGVWYAFALQKQGSVPTLPATVNRDCAPWDGAAFTVTVQYDSATIIHVSIWKSPDILFPSTFTFPDESGQMGNVYILPELKPYTPLRGEVWFQRVQEEMPLEGGFSLTSAGGETYEGRFTAEWGKQVVYCG